MLVSGIKYLSSEPIAHEALGSFTKFPHVVDDFGISSCLKPDLNSPTIPTTITLTLVIVHIKNVIQLTRSADHLLPEWNGQIRLSALR